MSNEREMAERNKILEFRVGSHLYGTNNENSDEDFSGVFIADPRFYYGLAQINEIDLSTVDKSADGKNTKEAIDKKLYEFRKFVKLAMDNNPNILEMLFVNQENITFNDGWFGERLLQNANLFPWVGCAQKFSGYAFSQKHKMVIKRDNMNNIKEAIYQLENCDPKALVADIETPLLKHGIASKVKDNMHLKIGDINIQRNLMVKKELVKLRERRDKFSHREELVSKYGYDTKFGMHLIRLMLEGKELLETGRIEFPLVDRAFLLDIRNGKYSCDEIIEMSEDFEADIERLRETTHLPKKPRYEEIEMMLMALVREYHG